MDDKDSGWVTGMPRAGAVSLTLTSLHSAAVAAAWGGGFLASDIVQASPLPG